MQHVWMLATKIYFPLQHLDTPGGRRPYAWTASRPLCCEGEGLDLNIEYIATNRVETVSGFARLVGCRSLNWLDFMQTGLTYICHYDKSSKNTPTNTS